MGLKYYTHRCSTLLGGKQVYESSGGIKTPVLLIIGFLFSSAKA